LTRSFAGQGIGGKKEGGSRKKRRQRRRGLDSFGSDEGVATRTFESTILEKKKNRRVKPK